ncbi:MAG: hypothetical protein QM755_23860 [Luteolibacter sp.]
MSTSIAPLESSMGRLDAIAAGASLLSAPGAPFSQAITTANAIREIRDALTDEIVSTVILPLMNTRLGFRTDRDPNRPTWDRQSRSMNVPEPYPLATVRECAIEATLRGLPMVGNCWNIIASNSYVTKEGFWFLIRHRIEGLTDFKVFIGVPKMIRAAGDAKNAKDEDAKGAVVPCHATWKVHGQADRVEREIPIRVNTGMGADAIMGKAERKILAAAHAQITGTTLGDAEVSEDEADSGMRNATPAAASTPTAYASVIDPFAVPEVGTETPPAEPAATTAPLETETLL